MSQEESTIKTADLALASVLVEKNYELLELERNYGNRVSFVFERTPEIEGVLADYWGNRITVNPRIYFDAIKHLKTRIYGG